MRDLERPVLILASIAAIVGCTRVESIQPRSAQDPDEIVLCGTGGAGPANLVQTVVERCRAGEWVQIELSDSLRGSEMLSVCDLTAPVLLTVKGISDKGAVLCRFRGKPRDVWLVRESDQNQLTLIQPFGTNLTKPR
jgi:hypothetical protein